MARPTSCAWSLVFSLVPYFEFFMSREDKASELGNVH